MKLKSITLNRHNPKVGQFEKEIVDYLKTSNDIEDLEVHDVPHNSTLLFLFKEGTTRTEDHEIVIIGPDTTETVISNANANIVKAVEENKRAKFFRLVVLSKTGRSIGVVLFKDKQLESQEESKEAPSKEDQAPPTIEEAQTQGNSSSAKRGRKKRVLESD